jgi:RND family efflux transporter MFP subunit
MSKKLLKIFIFILIVALLVLGGISLIKKRKAQLSDLPTPEKPVYVVKGAEVKKGHITVKETYLGKVYSYNTVKVATKFGGYIKKIKINEGDIIKKGQFLVEIDPTPIKLEIENLKTNIKTLKSQLDALLIQKQAEETALKTAENIYKRDKILYEKNAISKEKLEISQTNYEKAKALYNSVLSNIKSIENKIKETENQIKIKENDLNYLYITSPVNGVVSKVLLREGNFAGAGVPIAIIEKEGTYKILVSLPKLVKKETPVIVETEDKPVFAKINTIYPETDNNSLYIAEIKVNNLPLDIKIGSIVNVDFILSKKEGLIVPKNAILNLTNGSYVLTVKNGQFIKIPVKVIAEDKNNALIEGDVSEGTPVAIAEENKLRLLALGKKGRLIIEEQR